MSSILELEKRKLSIQGRRLLREWKQIEAFCENNKHISYIIRKRNAEGLPVAYEIIYKVSSIVAVEETVTVELKTAEGKINKEVRRPVFGDEHRMRIDLPNNFPSALGNPQLNFITDIWHPNIRSTGRFKGRVCSNEKDLGVTTSLASRILRIGQYLQYEMYHALDVYPYPIDSGVAEWVREEAEPMGWISKEKGLSDGKINLREKGKKNVVDKTKAPKVIIISKDRENSERENGGRKTDIKI